MSPHDAYGKDAEDRIKPAEWRKPRVIVIDENTDGNLFWGELQAGDFGQVVDTTLTSVVLDKIEPCVRAGQNAGTVTVDDIEYAFVARRNNVLRFHFANGQCVDVDSVEFGEDGIGATLDHLAAKHGGVVRVEHRSL